MDRVAAPAAERGRMTEAGRQAAASLLRSTAGKDDATAVDTNVASIDGLARLIHGLVAVAEQCVGTDCLGRRIPDGPAWVSSERLAIAEARLTRLSDTLAAIVRAAHGNGDAGLLVDWQGTAAGIADAARRALEDAAISGPAPVPAP